MLQLKRNKANCSKSFIKRCNCFAELSQAFPMIIQTLEHVALEYILPAFLKAFEGYFVKMPTSLDYWSSRFELTLVDLSASYGAFDGTDLVGFIIHGIDHKGGRKVAFNTGTGVLKPYRGQHLVDQMYQKAFEDLSSRGINDYELEVIVDNKVAIKVYERLGFSVNRLFKCFNGEVDKQAHHGDFSLHPCELNDCASYQNFTEYSWDFRTSVLHRAGTKYRSYLVQAENAQTVGYFVLDQASGTLAQIDAAQGNMSLVLGAVGSISRSIKINNVDSARIELIEALSEAGVRNTIDQFEMCLSL